MRTGVRAARQPRLSYQSRSRNGLQCRDKRLPLWFMLCINVLPEDLVGILDKTGPPPRRRKHVASGRIAIRLIGDRGLQDCPLLLTGMQAPNGALAIDDVARPIHIIQGGT